MALLLYLACGAPSHASKGRDLIRQKNYSQAILEFKASINQDKDYEGYLGLHDLYLIQGNKEQAWETIQNGIIKFPKAFPLYNARGNIYINANKFDEGISDLETAYKLDMAEFFNINLGQKSAWEQCIASAKRKKAEFAKSTQK